MDGWMDVAELDYASILGILGFNHVCLSLTIHSIISLIILVSKILVYPPWEL
jgi:hypothetical protein